MKILFTDLEQSETTYQLVNDGWLPTEELAVLEGPSGQTTATLTGSSEALVKGEMSCVILTSCDRCCTEVKLKLAADFAYICMVGREEHEQGHHDIECREEDYNRLYLKEPVIDLGEIYREQVYLSMPSQVLCDTACQGLCQVCGIDLNKTRCDCEQNEKESPFAVLRQLKKR